MPATIFHDWFIVLRPNSDLMKIECIGNKAKMRVSKRVFQENKACQNCPKNEHFLLSDTHTYVCVSGGVRNVGFWGNFGVLCSLETPVFRFALLPYHRRMNTSKDANCFPFQSLNMLPFYIRFKHLKLTYYSLLSNISEYSLKTATLPSFLIFSFICRFTIW